MELRIWKYAHSAQLNNEIICWSIYIASGFGGGAFKNEEVLRTPDWSTLIAVVVVVTSIHLFLRNEQAVVAIVPKKC